MKLRGRRLVSLKSGGDASYGQAHSWTDRKELHLCSDGSFQGIGSFSVASDTKPPQIGGSITWMRSGPQFGEPPARGRVQRFANYVTSVSTFVLVPPEEASQREELLRKPHPPQEVLEAGVGAYGVHCCRDL